MTDAQLKTFFQNLIDDESTDETFLAQLLSSAKNDIERKYKPPFLIDTDTSKTRAAGESYTSMKALPTDFREMLELYVGTIAYFPIPFQKRIFYRNSARRYYVDHKNSQFAVCGSGGAGDTITQVYLAKTDDITSDTIAAASTTLSLWPSEFRELVAWHAAANLSAFDADDITFRMSAKQKERYNELLESFADWIADQKLNALHNRGGFDPDEEIGEPSVERDLPYM